MPAPAMTPAAREERAAFLHSAQAESGRSMRALAIATARRLDANPDTMMRSFRRWTSPPRPGAIDGAPDDVLQAVKAIVYLPTLLEQSSARSDLPPDVCALLAEAALALRA